MSHSVKENRRWAKAVVAEQIRKGLKDMTPTLKVSRVAAMLRGWNRTERRAIKWALRKHGIVISSKDLE